MINRHGLYSFLNVIIDFLTWKSHSQRVYLFYIVSFYRKSSAWLLPFMLMLTTLHLR